MKPKPSVTALIAILSSTQNVLLRVKAASALGRRGSKKALPALIKALEDKHPLLRMLAAQSLGMLGDERAIPALKAAAKHAPDRPYQVTFRKALRACRPKAA
jgi:HEAT repeat protein